MVSHSDMTLWVLSPVHQERKKGREEGGMEDKEGRRKGRRKKGREGERECMVPEDNTTQEVVCWLPLVSPTYICTCPNMGGHS